MNDFNQFTEDLKNPEQSIRVKAAVKLGETGFSQAVKPLIDALKTEETPSVKAACAFSLGRLRDARAFVCLCEILPDPDPSVRKAAVSALSNIADLKTPYKIAEMLNDEDFRVRQEAFSCLSRTGSAAIEPLIKSLSSENPIVKWNAAILLGNSHDPRSVDPLIELLNDEDNGVRQAAIESLGKLRNPLAFDPLAEILTKGNSDTRYIVAENIDKVGGELALKPLVETLNQGDERLSISCLETLGRLKMPESIPAIYPFIFHNNQRLREQAALSLANTGNITADFLLSEMGKQNSEKREFIAQALEIIGEDIGRDIQMLLNGENDAESTIIQKKDPRTTIAVLSALKHGDADVKIRIISLLGKTGSPQSRELLLDLLKKTDDESVIIKIIQSIGEFYGKKGMETILSLFESSDNKNIRLQALEIIKQKGNTAVLTDLIRISRNTEPDLAKPISSVIETIVKQNKSLASKWRKLFCPKCLSRFREFKEKLSFLNNITFYACRNCKGDKYIDDVETVEVILDFHLDYFIAHEDTTLKINWLKRTIPVDFDRVVISAIDEKSLKQFIETTKNNQNPPDTKRKPEIRVTEDCEISPKKLQGYKEKLITSC
jgi:HEAT repeat protein